MKALLALLAVVPLLAQSSYYPRHNFTVGFGSGMPRGELSGLFANSAGVSFAYGYRFHRYFQVDGGVDTVFGAAGVRDFLPTQLGYLRIRDFEFLVPFGGRTIVPLARGRLLLSAGGGGLHLRYTERLRQPSAYYRVDCPVCSSRNGWGYYALLGGDVFLDRAKHFRVGATTKVYRGHTEGDSLGDQPAIRTRDQWIGVFGELGLSF